MCEYCDSGKDFNESLYDSKYISGGRTDELEIEIQGGKLVCFSTIDCLNERFGFDINYCFNCGRNLKETR